MQKFTLVFLIFFISKINYSQCGSFSVNAGQDTTICEGESIQIGNVANWNGSNTPIYYWTGSNQISNDSIATPIVFPASTTSFVVTVTADSCITSDTILVQVNSKPIISASPLNQVVCCDDTSAAITFFTNLPGTQFFWTNTNVSIGLASSGIGNISQFISPCTGTVPNIGHLIIFGIGPNGCQSDTILGSITNEPMPTIISQPIGGTYCLNDSASSIDLITTSLGSGIVTNHQWYSSNNPISSIPPSGGTLINGAINPSFTPPTSTAGTTYYYCVVNKSGTICELVSDTCSVTVHDLPNVSIQCDLPYDTICDYNRPIQFYSSPIGATFSGPGIDSTLLFNPSIAGLGAHIITASITDSNGCVGIDTAIVFVDPCLNLIENNFSNLKVYPNPTNDKINIKGLDNLYGISQIILTDSKGSSISKFDCKATQFDLSKVKSGVYFIKVKHSSGTDILKISKQ